MSDFTAVKVGVIGCGRISGIYLKNMAVHPLLNVTACADLEIQRAEERAAEFGVPRACTIDELLADPEVEIVVNLTIPVAHAEVAMAAIESGKSVYSEKPLAVELEDARRMLDAARSGGVLVGCAPDTFLGAGLQTCRKLIDDGAIGEPVAATAFMMDHGNEHLNPDPAFRYQHGTGPMFDMGPYYLTALVTLMGPARRVTGATRTTFPERTITARPNNGATFEVNTPTHVTGLMDFQSGAMGNIITSFDVWDRLRRIEVYGTEGSMSLPDPNTFGGPVRLRASGAEAEWTEMRLTHAHAENSRGLGVADMALALRSGEPHRASGEIAYHVLEIMRAFHTSSRKSRHVKLKSAPNQPASLPPDG